MKIETLKTAELVPYARNSRTHSEWQVSQIVASIAEFGFTNPILIDEDNGIIAGHGRVLAAEKSGLAKIPCIRLAHLSPAQRQAYVIADNKLAMNAGWDLEILAGELRALNEQDYDLGLTGFSNDEIRDLLAEDDENDPGGKNSGVPGGVLSSRFLIPPFSVLNAREGWWQARKKEWLALGIQSELGRGESLLKFSENAIGHYKDQKAQKAITTTDWVREKDLSGAARDTPGAGTSVFDPVLCELIYSWFCPPQGLVLDPFAGGSVRGVVASHLGREYCGMELRAEQVAANEAQAAQLCGAPVPDWRPGDSRTIAEACQDITADFVFSCPPYADLEVYSDDPADLSTMPYPEFRAAYFEIIGQSCSLLKPDRFACFVVGDIRDRKGNYRNFVGDTVEAFRAAGLHFYNEAILVTAVGSLPIRVGRQFAKARKLGKTHQNVLVFVKGSGKRATAACGEVEVYIPDPEQEGELGELGEAI